jgi:predicted acyl esterase
VTESTLAEPLGLTYTTGAFAEDVLMAGPASLEVRLSSTAPESGIWALLSDVWPDGSAHPVAAGRLLSSFPEINRRRSLRDPRTGAIVQPYGRFSSKVATPAGESRRYRVELWPIGNRFAAGHRLRLELVGASAAYLPGVPGLGSVEVGGAEGSRLLVPVLRGSDLGAALGGGG